MKPGYKLALELGIPVIVQPEWNEAKKLMDSGDNLRDQGYFFCHHNHKEEGERLLLKGWDTWRVGREMYVEAIIKNLGFDYIKGINFRTGEVKKT